MIVSPKIRGYICTTAHPVGCARAVELQIDGLRSSRPLLNGPKRVLVIGGSMGYGLSSRIVAAFGCRAATMAVFFEKPAEQDRTATAGWYHTAAFEKKALAEGLYARSFNGDAFSTEMKLRVAEAVRADWGAVDCIVYSLAAARRTDPQTGLQHRLTIKPVGRACDIKTLDVNGRGCCKSQEFWAAGGSPRRKVFNVSAQNSNDATASEWKFGTMHLEPATEEEIENTVKVMGGEDWAAWMDVLEKAGVLAPGCVTVAYSYIGSEITQPIYRSGTLGKAKEHLELTAARINDRLKPIGGRAVVSVNKALVTQSSAAIPFIPLYYILLTQVLSEKNLQEGCLQQMARLFSEKIYGDRGIVADERGLIRMDDYELRTDVASETARRWDTCTPETFQELLDFNIYTNEFLRLFGFSFPGVDYDEDVAISQSIPSLSSDH